MRETADMEDLTDKSAVTPGPIAPARELLGFMLLENSQPKEALVEFEAVMKKEPNRFLAIYGAGKAAEGAKQTAKAKGYYKQIVEMCKDAGTERPELAIRPEDGEVDRNPAGKCFRPGSTCRELSSGCASLFADRENSDPHVAA